MKVGPFIFLLVAAPALAEVQFNRDVRPLLTKHCTACHGGVKAAGGLSFIYRDKAMASAKSGKRPIVPGDVGASEMIRRVTSTDPEERMPKPEHGPALGTAEVDTLRQWITEGAKWDEHWSFMPPVDHPLPTISKADWPPQPLDHFILARLEKEGLSPAPEALPQEWLRRVSLDLIGLPPTLEEWEEFRAALAARPNEARAEVVDRLLKSPHFGERWATMWLDLARYADTQGFEKDLGRVIWPFRDWVIRAFNEDMPFDQFTLRQLAGDLLENPRPDDLIATAFHRNTWTNTEGGTDDEEYRIAAVIDRVNTTWTAWQATTFGCVRCHSHPYDPFPQEDYYRFMSFFDSTEDADLDNEFPLTKAANDPARQEEVVRLERALRDRREALNQAAKDVAEKIADWRIARAAKIVPTVATGRLEQDQNGVFLTGGTNPTKSAYALTFTPRKVGAARIRILPKSDDPKTWTELASVISHLTLAVAGMNGERRPVKIKEVVADFLAGPFDPNDSLDPNPGGFGDYPALRGPRWCVVAPSEPLELKEGESLELTIHHAVSCNAGNQPSILRKFTVELSEDGRLIEFLNRPARAEDWAAYKSAKKTLDEIPGTPVPTLLERRANAKRETRVFVRGNRMTKDKAVAPGIPEVSRPPRKEGPLNRLDMAKWLVSEENTLTARVLANRLWAELFGAGIVVTQEDFGTSGVPPTHPELLDHLAIRLAKQYGWRIKPLLRELALSATYRQANRAVGESARRDPTNRWLSRGPRTRLSAEMVRDQSLLAAGLLSRKQFGPPVYPPQPDGVWRTVYNGAKWETSKGEDRYRRSVYTYWKRTAAYPSFITFDMTARDICTPRRMTTNTPLQALVTLNDPGYQEMAKALAKRMADAGPGEEEQLGQGYRLLTSRDPSPEVLAILRELRRDCLAKLEKAPEEASALGATPAEAALVLVASTLMNMDEALSK